MSGRLWLFVAVVTGLLTGLIFLEASRVNNSHRWLFVGAGPDAVTSVDVVSWADLGRPAFYLPFDTYMLDIAPTLLVQGDSDDEWLRARVDSEKYTSKSDVVNDLIRKVRKIQVHTCQVDTRRTMALMFTFWSDRYLVTGPSRRST